MDKPGFWAALKGWRTMIVAVICGGAAAMIGAAAMLDWAAPLHDWLPTLPGWLIVLLASFIAGALRTITTTPLFKDKP